MKVPYMNWMIDTLRYVKALEAVGVDRKVAECQAKALAEALHGAAQTILTTKEDLRETEGNLQAEIQSLKADLRQTEAGLRADMQLLKEDLRQTESSLRGDLRETEARLRIDMQQQELRLTKQMNTIMVKTISILGGLMAFLGGLDTLLHFY